MSTLIPATADSSTTSPAPAPTVATNNPIESVSRPTARRLPCLRCQQRKAKCDRNKPCSNCVKGRVECVSPNTDLPRPRKKRFAEAELLARLRRYEAYFKENGLDPDAIGRTDTDPAASERDSVDASTPYATSSRSVPRSPTPRTLKK